MNSAQPLYDLAPLLRMLALGALIALVPLAWVLWRNRGAQRSRRWQALTVLTLFLTFDLVLFGAFTRLTDSGLGCPDWPGCYGNASPLGAHADISAAQTALPSGPVTHGKAWVEMVHRYLATSVGALITVLAVAAWLGWWRARRAGRSTFDGPSPGWATLTLVWVCIQGAFGALTVTMKLFPAIVTLHLAGGVVLLALLCVQAVRQTAVKTDEITLTQPAGLRKLAWWGLAMLSLQVLLGGWVSTNYAVLACSSFPSCQGSWWPDMNFAQGFSLWRHLGVLSDGRPIDFSALTAIHYTHRLFSYAVFVVLGFLAWRLHRAGAGLWSRQARWLAGLLLLQFMTGLSNVVLDWPLPAAVLHTGGAAALVVVLTWILETQRPRAQAAPAPMAQPRIVEAQL
ncbi:MAG: COX15/CtaA family protein [Simplicispira suum]|uniref:COX15/CtaA family protein n=1 Tax=Simplicispira suum TaxID=2109915 RepID=UPI001C6BDCC5|nr:COX15/CtaA family protein [Simplicispira suum]MBW7832746.1 COX15/CtaA family protein [Simplicispira suum]